MQSSSLLFLLLAFLGVLDALRPRHHQSRDIYSSKRDVYRKLQARIVPVVSASTTHVRTSRKVQPVTKMHGKRQATTSSRISASLKHFLQTIDEEGAKIKSFAIKTSSPDTILDQIKEPLQNIVKAAQQTLASVKNSEFAPTPSGGFHNPPKSPCSLILDIIRSLKSILESLFNVVDASKVKESLGDIFTQITGIVAQLISEIESKLPGALNDILQTGHDIIQSLTNAANNFFGFDDILNVLKHN